MEHQIASSRAKARRSSAYRSQQKRRRSRRSRRSRKLAAGQSRRRRRGSQSTRSASGYSTNQKVAMAATGLVGVGATVAAVQAQRAAAAKLKEPLPPPPPPRKMADSSRYLDEIEKEIIKRRAQVASLRSTHPKFKTLIDLFERDILFLAAKFNKQKNGATATADDVSYVTSRLEELFQLTNRYISLEPSISVPVPGDQPADKLAAALAQVRTDYEYSIQIIDSYKEKATQETKNEPSAATEKPYESVRNKAAKMIKNWFDTATLNENSSNMEIVTKLSKIEEASLNILKIMDKFVRKMQLIIAKTQQDRVLRSLQGAMSIQSYQRAVNAVNQIYIVAFDAIDKPQTTSVSTAESIKQIEILVGDLGRDLSNTPYFPWHASLGYPFFRNKTIQKYLHGAA